MRALFILGTAINLANRVKVSVLSVTRIKFAVTSSRARIEIPILRYRVAIRKEADKSRGKAAEIAGLVEKGMKRIVGARVQRGHPSSLARGFMLVVVPIAVLTSPPTYLPTDLRNSAAGSGTGQAGHP